MVLPSPIHIPFHAWIWQNYFERRRFSAACADEPDSLCDACCSLTLTESTWATASRRSEPSTSAMSTAHQSAKKGTAKAATFCKVLCQSTTPASVALASVPPAVGDGVLLLLLSSVGALVVLRQLGALR